MKTTITTNFTKTSLRVLRGLLLICLLAFTGTTKLNAQDVVYKWAKAIGSAGKSYKA